MTRSHSPRLKGFGSVFEEWFKKFQTDNAKIKPRTEARNRGMMNHVLGHPIAKREIGSIEPERPSGRSANPRVAGLFGKRHPLAGDDLTRISLRHGAWLLQT